MKTVIVIFSAFLCVSCAHHSTVSQELSNSASEVVATDAQPVKNRKIVSSQNQLPAWQQVGIDRNRGGYFALPKGSQPPNIPGVRCFQQGVYTFCSGMSPHSGARL